MKNEIKKRRPALSLALVGIMAGILECSKLILSFIPNVEVVTILSALFGYVFGWIGVLSTVVFVCIEPLIWGFGTWMISYFIYWPLVSLVFLFLSRLRVKNRWLLTLAALILTAFFGVLTSLVDLGLFSGFFDNFIQRFIVYYARGAVFYLIQLICNAVLFPLLFPFLSDKLNKISEKL
jgi:hypothetical protein